MAITVQVCCFHNSSPTIFLVDLEQQILHLQMDVKNCGFKSKANSSTLSNIHRGVRLLEMGAVQSQGYAFVLLASRTWGQTLLFSQQRRSEERPPQCNLHLVECPNSRALPSSHLTVGTSTKLALAG